ncbi:MAG: Arc family DNA-binding protein [Candidatus Sedimenticola sp. (ex Thyasira tokunagai)]
MGAQDDFIRTQIRFPPEVHEALVKAAEVYGRSLNAEIIHRLEQSLAVDEQAKAYMEGDPLKGIVKTCDLMAGNVTSIVALAMKAGIESGKIKVKDDAPEKKTT